MIVDASVAFKWLVREPDSDPAIAWIAGGEPLSAPAIIIAETGHALTKRIRLGELQADGAREQFERLPGFLTILDDLPFAGRALELSIALHHSFYDCVYLAATEATGDRLLTADRVLATKLASHPLAERIVMLEQAS